MSVEVTIVCDRCSRVASAAKTATKARTALREAGGRVSLPGGKDICEWCVVEAKEAVPQDGAR